ncbi:MAG: AMP-binding protein [Propionibacteriaceae bacterium]|jgi:long-chain acyl-CoA synthetase|nr:AMP-binding protein [Propionibacteriaceae bacterium]
MPFTDFYQPGVPAQIELPTDSLVELYETAVAGGGESIALDFFGKTTSYRTLGEQIGAAAESLRQLGVQAGDRVALILPNCPAHVIAFYAIIRLGAVVVEHNPLYTPRELRHLFEDHAAQVAICWDSAVPKLHELPEDIAPATIIAVNMIEDFPRRLRLALKLPLPSIRQRRAKLSGKAAGAIAWHSLIDHRPALSPDHPRPDVHDLAAIQYTSGTTGLPKGAMLSHYNLYANARQGAAWMHGAMDRQEIFYAVLPMFHSFGMTLFLTYGVLKQATIHLFPTFDVDLVMTAAKRQPPTVFCAVPPIFEKTALAARKRHISLKSAKYCISGAMTLPEATVELWESQSGGLLVEGYGMTEASPVALGNPFWSTRRTGTIGIPFPSTSMKVVDVDDPSIEVEQGQRGELLLAGPQIFQGYWHNPSESEAALLPGRWLRTGDIVTQDADGFTTIVDRKKELIITGGFNVAPSEVEQVIKSFPDVADAAVIGLPDERVGERVVAAVVPRAQGNLDLAALRAFCHERLTGYKVPRQFFIRESLPTSMLGKVLRAQVRSQLEQLSDATASDQVG